MELKINIDGVDLMKNAIKKFMEDSTFQEDVTEEYKQGFYDFGNAVIKVLEKEVMNNER